VSDLRQAVRLIARAPVFAATVVLILAVAIAGNTAAFSAAHVLLWQPLPFADADRLVVVGGTHRASGARAGISLAEYRDWIGASAVFDGTAAVALEQSFDLASGSEPLRATGGRMTAGLLPLVGVKPVRGRAFRDADEQPGAAPVALISERHWTTHHARSIGAIDSEIVVDGVRTTIVGVLPSDFKLLYGGYSLWLPLRAAPIGGERPLMAVARLRPGVTPDVAGAELNRAADRLERDGGAVSIGWRPRLLTMREFLLAGRGNTLTFLVTALALLLLVASANVASLQLARGAARRREIATRLAIGASRGRIVRQLLAEAALLACAAGVLALGLVAAARRILLASSPDLRELVINLPVLAVTIALMGMTAIISGLAPALVATRLDLTSVLKGAGTRRGAASRTLSLLVVIELAVSLALLAPAALLVRSYRALQQVEPGFAVEGVLTLPVSLPAARYRDDRARADFHDEAVARLAALPGVRAVAATDALPLDPTASADARIAGTTEGVPLSVRTVGPGYFDAFAIPIVAGRGFDARDRQGALPVAVVNQALARRIPAERNALGAVLDVGGAGRVTVVGIAADARSAGLRTAPQPELLLPIAQRPRASFALALAVTDDPMHQAAAVRAALYAVDPDLPFAPRTMAAALAEQLTAARMVSLLLAALAAIALALASAGLAGVVSRLVLERTPEMGLRAALGATRRQVATVVVRHAVVLVGCGLVLGLGAAVALGQMIASTTFGVSAWDPAAYALVAGVVVAATGVVCFAPIRRAATIDPASALRSL
jgi:putative ABC transport system permease protein